MSIEFAACSGDGDGRTFLHAFFGVAVLAGLYFEWNELLYLLVAINLIEGIANRVIIRTVAGATHTSVAGGMVCPAVHRERVIDFEATRGWRLVIGLVLLVSILFTDQLWYLSWFIGFAVLGAGLSGVCPLMWLLCYVGFK
ncbi:hypothetical protein BOW53_04030 [Solemya pervernicosa gill symbiont]|uniref:DUF2892 domain-containing protein n=1 Tax=Solemya pervernicosa gill symbiont TaxID=642797 RepID=A0A1T2L8K9_9GAMM|nr:hypothetical protein BOW53_04030 [Solemya pervernicosa gill symbiont]